MLSNDIPYFIVKKVFSKIDKNTVVLCEYSGKQTPEERLWQIYPADEEIILKKIELQNTGLIEIQIKGIKRKKILCGSYIFPESSASYFGKNFTGIFPYDSKKIKLKGKYILCNNQKQVKDEKNIQVEIKQFEYCIEVTSSSEFPIFIGNKYSLYHPDTLKEAACIIAVYPGEISKEFSKKASKIKKKQFVKIISSKEIEDFNKIFSIPFFIDGFVKLPDFLIGKINLQNSRTFGKWIINDDYLNVVFKKLKLLSQKAGGISFNEAIKKININKSLLDILIKKCFTKEVTCFKGYIQNKNTIGELFNLSPAEKDIYNKIKETGFTGYDFRLEKNNFKNEIIFALSRSGLVVLLENRIAFDFKIYKRIVTDILEGIGFNKETIIQNLKNITGFSRKYLIPFLDKMENDGYLISKKNRTIIRRKELL